MSPTGWDTGYLSFGGVHWASLAGTGGTVTLTYQKRGSSEKDVWKVKIASGT